MIRALAQGGDGRLMVLLGLDAQNLDRLREGQPIKVNLRHLDPSGAPVPSLPDLDVLVAFVGVEEREFLEQLRP